MRDNRDSRREEDGLLRNQQPAPWQEVASRKGSQECEVTGLPRGSIWWVPPEVRKGIARKTRSEQQGRYLVCNAEDAEKITRQGAVVLRAVNTTAQKEKGCRL